jgi:3D (Asp-Asp-Asp) domain-containing protein
MKKRATAATIVAAAVPVKAQGHAPETVHASSTAYSPCSSGSTMADGTRTRWGSVASNWHALGTRIRLTRPILGRRLFIVRDRIGHGTQLDIWMPSCSGAVRYGRRAVSYVVVG